MARSISGTPTARERFALERPDRLRDESLLSTFSLLLCIADTHPPQLLENPVYASRYELAVVASRSALGAIFFSSLVTVQFARCMPRGRGRDDSVVWTVKQGLHVDSRLGCRARVQSTGCSCC